MTNNYILANYLNKPFKDDIKKIRKSTIKSTGFSNLDEMNLGLKNELYLLAGVPSIGKSTFALQLAIQVAKQKKYVLYVALEQSQAELAVKCLINEYSRQNFNNKEKLLYDINYSTSNCLHRNSFNFDNIPIEAISSSFSNYLIIWDGGYNVKNIPQMHNFIESDLKDTPPSLIIVDYLQILSPRDKSAQISDKQRVDMIVHDLQNEIQGEYNIPVIAISSVNRSSYLSPITLQSLKESGSLDYGADVIWTLQPDIVFNFADKDTTETRERKLRKDEKISPSKGSRLIRLGCIKNRMGAKSSSCLFNYYPKLEFFEETGAEKAFETKNTASQEKLENNVTSGERISIC